MPKTVYFSPGDRSGISVVWWKTTGRLSFGGWYDSMVGIEGENVTLREFFDRLGITEKDCQKAFKDESGTDSM